jgi:hypothetical protein
LLRSLAQNVREGARDLARHIVVFGCWEAQRPLRRSVTPSRTCAHTSTWSVTRCSSC